MRSVNQSSPDQMGTKHQDHNSSPDRDERSLLDILRSAVLLDERGEETSISAVDAMCMAADIYRGLGDLQPERKPHMERIELVIRRAANAYEADLAAGYSETEATVRHNMRIPDLSK